eukprot:365673-Chlamydomonas_euryale.AAC.2
MDGLGAVCCSRDMCSSIRDSVLHGWTVTRRRTAWMESGREMHNMNGLAREAHNMNGLYEGDAQH